MDSVLPATYSHGAVIPVLLKLSTMVGLCVKTLSREHGV